MQDIPEQQVGASVFAPQNLNALPILPPFSIFGSSIPGISPNLIFGANPAGISPNNISSRLPPNLHFALLTQLKFANIDNNLKLPVSSNLLPQFFTPNPQNFFNYHSEQVVSTPENNNNDNSIGDELNVPSPPLNYSRPPERISSSVRGFSIADLLRSSPEPSKTFLYPNFISNSQNIFFNQNFSSESQVKTLNQKFNYAKSIDGLAPDDNCRNTSKDNSRHLEPSGRQIISPSRSSPTVNDNKFEWMNCTRYKPPKLPRVRRRENICRRKLGRNPRVPFSANQLATLESRFRQTQYLSSCDVAEISAILNLTDIRVKIWFQNRRARERRDRLAKHKNEPIETQNSKNPPIMSQNSEEILRVHLKHSATSAFSPVGQTPNYARLFSPVDETKQCARTLNPVDQLKGESPRSSHLHQNEDSPRKTATTPTDSLRGMKRYRSSESTPLQVTTESVKKFEDHFHKRQIGTMPYSEPLELDEQQNQNHFLSKSSPQREQLTTQFIENQNKLILDPYQNKLVIEPYQNKIVLELYKKEKDRCRNSEISERRILSKQLLEAEEFFQSSCERKVDSNKLLETEKRNFLSNKFVETEERDCIFKEQNKNQNEISNKIPYKVEESASDYELEVDV